MSFKLLFDFHFTSRLEGHSVELLQAATGMRITDVDYLWKEDPGRGEITPGVNGHLFRPHDKPNEWQLTATTRVDDYDTAAVMECRERLLLLLPDISESWEEKPPTNEQAEPESARRTGGQAGHPKPSYAGSYRW